MAITSHDMIWIGESLSDANVRTLTTKYRAISNDGTADNVATVWNDSRTPSRGDANPWDGTLTCSQVQVDRGDESNRIEFIVTATWTNEAGDAIDLTLDAKLLEPPEIEFESGEAAVAFEKTADGKPVINTARDTFDPAPSVSEARPVLSFTRNEADFEWDIARNYVNHTNSASFLGAEPGEIRLSRVRANKVILPEFYYWRVTYVFEYRKSPSVSNVFDGDANGDFSAAASVGGWDLVLQSVGYNQLVVEIGTTQNTLKQVPIKLGSGTDAGSPQWLDANGAYVPPPRTQGQAVYVRFKQYPEADFNALNISI